MGINSYSTSFWLAMDKARMDYLSADLLGFYASSNGGCFNGFYRWVIGRYSERSFVGSTRTLFCRDRLFCACLARKTSVTAFLATGISHIITYRIWKSYFIICTMGIRTPT